MNKRATIDVVDTGSVSVRLLVPATYHCTNMPSGRQYNFPGAGAEVKVDPRDVDALLSKKTPAGCCGTVGGKPIFELV